MTTAAGIDWPSWLRHWDGQQAGYVPDREARFTAMLDVLDQLLPASFVAIDLACGPGSISQRLLARFPAAQAVAVDMDPVMLALGQGVLGTVDGRLRWVDADLASPGWTRAVGLSRVDAVLSSTALHWLPTEDLQRLYRDLAQLLPPGGLFLNADHLPYGPTTPTLAQVSEHALDELWSDESFATRGVETAEQWWEALAQQPGLVTLQAERARRFDSKTRPERATLDDHVTALRTAGFSETGTIWQTLSDRVLLAVRYGPALHLAGAPTTRGSRTPDGARSPS